jgi:hypothetical protein
METVQIPLPPELVQRLQQELPADLALSEVVAEALQLWLEKRQSEKRQQARGLEALRRAGLAMEGTRQRALAEAMLPALRPEDQPDRNQVEAALWRLKVPLSEDLIAMRGGRG